MRRAGPEIISSLEPGSNSDQELPSSGLFTLRTPEICRVAKGALVLHADIGRELGHELIAQTQSQFGRGEAGAYEVGRASFRARVCRYGEFRGVEVGVKKKTKRKRISDRQP